MRRIIFIVLIVCLTGSKCLAAQLEVNLVGDVEPGTLYLAMYDAVSGRNWGDEPILKTKVTVPSHQGFRFMLPDIPTGSYALRAFVDVNNNEKLDKNGMGIPKEPVAISGAKDRSKRSRSFQSAIFSVGEDVYRLNLHVFGVAKQSKTPLNPASK